MKQVSLILPTIRRQKAARCIEAALKYKGLTDIEIVQGFDTDRIGAPKMVKRLVDKSRHDLVMFLGDDTIPNKGYMK